MIVLASQSPRRQELLRRIGIRDFAVRVPQAEENYPPQLSPEETVAYISRKKALAARALVDPADLVIAADTMVFLDRQRLGKPRDEEQALEMLTALQGRSHSVCTGVTVMQGQRLETQAERTTVRFRSADRQELLRYIASGEPMDKAGAYGVQGLGALLVEGIEGDFYNVMGLPLLRLARMLALFGMDLLK